MPSRVDKLSDDLLFTIKSFLLFVVIAFGIQALQYSLFCSNTTQPHFLHNFSLINTLKFKLNNKCPLLLDSTHLT